MPRKAIINGSNATSGTVENVILADDGFALPGKTLIASDTAAPCDTWDGETFTPAVPAPAPPPSWPSLDFMERFTESEQLAIVTATLANPAVKLWYDKAMAAGTVKADDPRTVAGMAALVGAGLITAERHDQILGMTSP